MKSTLATAPISAEVAQATPPGPPRKMLGRVLVDQGVLSTPDLLHALDLQGKIDARLGDILVSEGFVDADELQSALSEQHLAPLVDLDAQPPEKACPACCLPRFVCVMECCRGARRVTFCNWPPRTPKASPPCSARCLSRALKSPLSCRARTQSGAIKPASLALRWHGLRNAACRKCSVAAVGQMRLCCVA